MVRTIDQPNLDVDDRITRHQAVGHCFLMPLSTAGMYSLERYRRRSSSRRCTRRHALAARFSSQTWPNWPLPPTAYELAFGLDRLADGPAVGHLRLADVGLDIELALHAVDEDIEVQLTHAGDDRLAGFLVGAHAERRVLLSETTQGNAHLFLVGLGLRLDRHRDDGLREDHPLQGNDVILRAQRVAGGHILKPTAAAMSPPRLP